MKKFKRFGVLFFWGSFLILFQNCAGDNLGKMAAGISSQNSASSGTSLNVPVPVTAPVIQSFTSTQTQVKWVLSGGALTSLTLSANGAPAENVLGTLFRDVAPAVTTTYTLVATNNAGFVSATTTITVASPTPSPSASPSPSSSPVVTAPLITSLTSSAPTINSGGSSTISWTLSGSATTSLTLNGSSVTGSSKSFSPTTTTTYTLAAGNSAGNNSGSLTITVMPASSSTWIYCADENGNCAFSGTHRVTYGLSELSLYAIITATDGSPCDNNTFTDPAPGHGKTCWYESAGTASPTPTPTASPSPSSSPVAGSMNATFKIDTSTALDDNPERGFYNMLELNQSGWCEGTMSGMVGGSYQGQPTRLFLYKWNPSPNPIPFPGGNPVPVKTAAKVRTELDCVRAAGAKVIITIVYTYNYGQNEGLSLNQLLADVDTLGSIVTDKKDVIAAVRMGSIGAYGEWWNSGGGFDSEANKRTIKDRYLSAVPVEIPIMIREPANLQYWYPTPVSAANAYTNTPIARFGTYSDCFMSMGTDGSYRGPGSGGVPVTTSAQQQRTYAASQNNYTMFGGETCDVDPMRMSCSDVADGSGLPPNNGAGGIMNEGPRYHVTYLNRGFNIAFENTWQSQGCYADVNNLMGYRFQYNSINHPGTVVHGTSNNIFTVTMLNYGWSRPFSARQLQARLVKSGATDIVCKFDLELRRLDPLGSKQLAGTNPGTPMTSSCSIPSSATPGTYSVYLEMPDVQYSGFSAPGTAFKIRNANANSGGQSWDSSNRRFSTGTTVTVQ